MGCRTIVIKVEGIKHRKEPGPNGEDIFVLELPGSNKQSWLISYDSEGQAKLMSCFLKYILGNEDRHKEFKNNRLLMCLQQDNNGEDTENIHIIEKDPNWRPQSRGVICSNVSWSTKSYEYVTTTKWSLFKNFQSGKIKIERSGRSDRKLVKQYAHFLNSDPELNANEARRLGIKIATDFPCVTQIYLWMRDVDPKQHLPVDMRKRRRLYRDSPVMLRLLQEIRRAHARHLAKQAKQQ